MSCCEPLFNALPVLGIYILILYSYYMFVVIICIYTIADSIKQISYLTFYHIIFLMMMWSHFATTCATHDNVPPRYRIDVVGLSSLDLEQLSRTIAKFSRKRRLLLYMRNDNDTIRFCRKCKHVKPDRTHHCSSCERCILKMDHHCPWMNNCVGHANYKQYILLLVYSVVYCAFCCGTSLEHMVDFFVKDSIEPWYGYQILAMTIVTLLAGILLMALLCYHINMLLSNKTTLEDMKDPYFIHPSFTFDLGGKENFTSVFGENCCLWFFPIKTATTNGYEFPVKKISY